MTEATREGASAAEQLMARWSEEPTEQEETSEVEETEEPGVAETEGSDVEPEAEATEESEAREYDLSDIASVLGYDESDLAIDEDGKVKIKVKIDGEERLATPAELRKSYQLEGHLNKNNMEVAEQRKALQAKEQELTQSFQKKLSEAQTLAQVAYQQLAQEYQSVDWDKLRAEDPHEWSIQRQAYQERNEQIAQALQQIQHQGTQMQQQRRKEEMQRLLEAIPEWKDQNTFQEESRKLVTGLQTHYGIPEQITRSIDDHKFFLLARDALRHRELQSKKPEVTKKVKAAPKVVKPGQPVSKQTLDEKKLATLKKRAEKGERGAVAGLLMERWK